MSGYKTFKFIADTIDGQIQQSPKLFYLRCDEVKPIGNSVVRQFDGNECINAMKVYLVYYRGQLLGSKGYQTAEHFFNFMQSECKECGVTINGCLITINGCFTTIN